MRVAPVVALAVSVLATAFALQPSLAKPVTSDDLVKAQDNAGEWLMYGRDYRNWRYSPLAEITPDNAAQLRPVWAMSTGGQFGGLEATPLFRDGVLYFSGRLCAGVRARCARPATSSGATSPNMSEGFNAMLCCGPIHRGVALKDDLVYRRPPRREAGRPQPRRRQGRLGGEDRRLEERRDHQLGARWSSRTT